MYVCIYWINIYLCDNVYLFTGFIYPNILSHQTQPTPLCPQFLRLNYWLYFMRSIVLVCWCCKALQMNVLFSWDDKIFDTFFEKFYSNPYIMLKFETSYTESKWIQRVIVGKLYVYGNIIFYLNPQTGAALVLHTMSSRHSSTIF